LRELGFSGKGWGNGAGEVRLRLGGCTCFWWFSKTTKREMNAFRFFYVMDTFVLILLALSLCSYSPSNRGNRWINEKIVVLWCCASAGRGGWVSTVKVNVNLNQLSSSLYTLSLPLPNQPPPHFPLNFNLLIISP